MCGYIGNATELSLPENYKGENYVIGDDAFSYCSSLTSVTIPNSVTSIGSSAFYYCKGLTSVTIPNRVTSIEVGTFAHCSSLTSVTIPNSVTSIEVGTFAHCSSLTSVTIPNSVTSIGNKAFYNCNSLKTVINYSSLTISKGSSDYGYVGYYADKVINAPNGSIEGDFVWAKIDGNNTLCVYIGYATELSLPENYKGENYVIGDYAFYKCSSLTSVTIPNSVTSIGDYAFYYCRGLTSVTIPNRVTSIGSSAFYYCSSLTSVTIPNSVTSIGYQAFYGSGLRYIHIPNVNNIGSNLFSNCNELTKVSLNCKRVDNFFGENKNINELILGNNVIGILDNTLSGCSGIKTIRLTNSIPPKVGANNFTSSHYQNATLYVPKGSLATYQAADVWKEFWEIVEFDATGIEGVNANDIAIEVTANGITLSDADGKTVAIYSANGTRVANIDSYVGEEITLDRGVYIVRVGNNTLKVKL